MSEGLCDLPKVPELLSGKARIWSGSLAPGKIL